MIIDEDVFLEHYGIRGMHWGIRRSKEKTGITRVRSAQIDINKRSLLYLKRAKNRKHALTKGLSFMRAWHNSPRAAMHISTMRQKLNAQNKRLKKGGHPTGADFVKMYGAEGIGIATAVIPKAPAVAIPGRITVPQLFISNRPKKPVS